MSEYPRHDEIPACLHRQIGMVRIFRKRFPDGSVQDRLECLYEDGYGKPFWAPLPVFEADA